MDKIISTKKELAKSWFVMAQLFMILAGFLFVMVGVAHSSSVGTRQSLYNDLVIVQVGANQFTLAKLNGTAKDLTDDLFIAYGDIIEKNERIRFFGLIFGPILVVFSLIFWLIGRNRLRLLKKFSSSSPTKH